MAEMSRLQCCFVERIYPVVVRWARKSFGRNDDAVSECVAIAWKWVRGLVERGRNPFSFRCKLAQLVVRAVRSGRRLVGKLKAKDAMNPQAWQRHGFTVSKLPDFSTESANPLAMALADHGTADPADHAAFRIDWPLFLAAQPERYQKLAALFALGESNQTVARTLGLSQGRTTQMRKALRDRWQELHGA
jgi:hypothetical protein